MLSRFPNSTLKVGAKVSLSPQSRMLTSEGGGRGGVNPLGVVGVVQRKESSDIYVKWPTYRYEVNYRINDYDLIAEGEPGFLATE